MNARRKSKLHSEKKKTDIKKKQTPKKLNRSPEPPEGAKSISPLQADSFFWGVLVLFILPVSLAKIYDPDIWWHMQLGRNMLENMGLPDFSKFYFSPVAFNYSDLRFTWLGDIFLYCVHWLGGDIGLQFLRVGFVIFSCFLFKSIAGSRSNGWHLLMLMLFVVGVYQKQLIRNSLFSLVFTVFLLWLWHRIRYENKEKLLWAIPFLLAAWGCIHGSYLLGFGLTLLIFAGDWIDSLRGCNPGKKRFTLHYAAVILISFSVISAWNPLTAQYFSITAIKNLISHQDAASPPKNDSGKNQLIVRNEKETSPAVGKSGKEPREFVPVKTAGVEFKGFVQLLLKMKNALNNTIFKQDNATLRSADFISPFDKFDRMYVKVSFFLGFSAVVLLVFFSRPIRFSNLIPFFAVLIFGLGYLRMTGYISILAVGTVFIAGKNLELDLKINDRWVKSFCAVLLVAMYLNLAAGFKVPVGTELHAFGFGRIPTFSRDVSDKILRDHKNEKVFTTIMNGGFFLYHWYPHKKVFLDGFFAPHPYRVFSDYSDLLRGKLNPDLLFEKYDISIAIIEQNKSSLNTIFLDSPNWYVLYIDQGNIVYNYEPDYDSNIPAPSIISDEKAVHQLPNIYRQRFAKYLLLIQNSLIKEGRLKDLNEFQGRYGKLLEELNRLAEPAQINYVNSMAARYVKDYGIVNSRTIAHEISHFQAAEKGDLKAVEKFGLKVLEKAPNRFPVLFNMASVYASHRDVIKSKAYLDKLWRVQKKDNASWENNRFNVAKLCLNLFYMEKKNGKTISAYRLLSKAHFADDSVVSEEKLYEEGIKLAREETAKDHAGGAYEILKTMEKDFPESGRLFNEIAWLILNNPDQIFVGIKKAKEYAKKATRLMEKNRDPILDTAYDTLAEAYFQLKEFDKMLEYEKNAKRVAPPERKGLYRHRLRQKDNG